MATAMHEPALTVDDLSVRLADVVVLDHLSFSVAARSILAVIGPNGAGKTVLFKALIGALPHAGRIRWAPGTRIGYVPQKLDIERNLPLTGADFLRARAALSKASREDVLRALDRVSLAHGVLERSIGAMSGGQFQRLLMAFALVGKPSVLLLDEPTAGVDEPGQETLNEMIHRLNERDGVTILLISHDLSVVFRYATAVLCLSRDHPCFGHPQSVLTPEALQGVYGAPVGYHVHDGPRR